MQSQKPHANLTALHFAFFLTAMVAIFGWGLVVLESDLARADAALIAER